MKLQEIGLNIKREMVNMSLYNHCRYRNSYDCADGYCNCENCGDFQLDAETLTPEQRKAVQFMLELEEK